MLKERERGREGERGRVGYCSTGRGTHLQRDGVGQQVAVLCGLPPGLVYHLREEEGGGGGGGGMFRKGKLTPHFMYRSSI